MATGITWTEYCIPDVLASGTVTVIYNISANSESLLLTFNCNDGLGGITLNGIISFIANFNSSTGYYDVRFGGDITFTFSDASTLSMVMMASETGNNFSYDFSVSMDYSVFGSLGSYLVTTTQPLMGNYLSNQYTNGVIIIQGANDTRLRITITGVNRGYCRTR